MKALIRLELRKQRKSFLGLLLIIVVSLTFLTSSISVFSKPTFGEMFWMISLLFQLLGLPFFALLLGGSAGATLRHSQRKAEEEIPVRASKRVLAAYFASLIYLILLAAILSVLSLSIRSLQADFSYPVVLVVLLPLHSAAFVFSYWLSQALVGSIIAVIAIILPTCFFFPNFLFRGMNFTLISFNVGPGLATVCIQLSLLLWLSNRMEREKRTWLPMKIAIGLLLVSALCLSVWGFAMIAPKFFFAACD
jgi:hypothetical protein